MLDKTGVATPEQVKSRFPQPEQLLKPKAIIECYEDIPCNPCSTSCPFHAIEIGDDINNQPQLNVDLCTGCGICVTSCPGLAIMTAEIRNNLAIFKIPYEFLPYPEPNSIWNGVNRDGKVICDANIVKVLLTNKQDKTVLVTVSVDKKYLYDFVTVRNKNE
ncbi:MAG: 4Fe-4S binding protein [Candidatus Izemoplasmatales bacterium]|jgi:Fe-S-cluster-containing hydrogenase component 2|nr:4Fe-4S binding protein [Candidatus Izemoplasmatales bacterium]MDD3865176.1 4Fe-4S binding protein [Candidatus Izemoplasmatales bacterium]